MPGRFAIYLLSLGQGGLPFFSLVAITGESSYSYISPAPHIYSRSIAVLVVATVKQTTERVRFSSSLNSLLRKSYTRYSISVLDIILLSCPFVTTVGGTTGINPEVAVSFSGGGFSRYFARPSYQDKAVQSFLTGLGTTYQGLYKYRYAC
jgi:hypothetical protein